MHQAFIYNALGQLALRVIVVLYKVFKHKNV